MVHDYAVTFACYNQLTYTRELIDSLERSGVELARVVAVDNASTDETRDYLNSLPLGGRIFNKANLGCGVAWTQGALALQAEWTVVMNNDVLVSSRCIQKLICAATKYQLKIASPALIEGPLDYDFYGFAEDATMRMHDALRPGDCHAVCMAVHRSVWAEIGYFRLLPKLWGYEDTLFFHEARLAGIPLGITGSAWLHHFGSVTVNALKAERGLSSKEGLGARRNYRLLNLPFWERKLRRFRLHSQRRRWRRSEVARYGMSLHATRVAGNFHWL
jgi:GT2 family glycosyltransferase